MTESLSLLSLFIAVSNNSSLFFAVLSLLNHLEHWILFIAVAGLPGFTSFPNFLNFPGFAGFDLRLEELEKKRAEPLLDCCKRAGPRAQNEDVPRGSVGFVRV